MLIADGDVRMHGDAVCAAVEEQHVPPCVQGALDIAGRGIADVPCLGRVEPQRLLDMKESAGIRLLHADHAGDEDVVFRKPARQPEPFDLAALMVGRAVGQDADGQR